MHRARVETSPRLQRVLNLLWDGRHRTTREIVLEADVCAVNSIIAELRANGFNIVCTAVGIGKFEYRMVKEEDR
ncbi:MAG: hypothetical protein HY760_00500 [Nitrospirae bacterium]|nr:hypothetical protein [Nitrospirota bacterium]